MKHTDPIALSASMAEALHDRRPEVRAATIGRLKEIYVSCEAGTCTTNPDVARAALPHARRALADPDQDVRVTGIRAIELLAADAKEAVFDLADALLDPVSIVRFAALEALCEFGAAAAPVAPGVAERLAHGSTPSERSAAADCLGNAGAQVDHLDLLLSALVRDVPAVQASAAHALALALDDEREEVRERVSAALHGLSRG